MGIFAFDLFGGPPRPASALWVLTAALLGAQASKVFLVIFGALYLGDEAFGPVTGWGYLDFGTFTHPSEGSSLTLFRIFGQPAEHRLWGAALGQD